MERAIFVASSGGHLTQLLQLENIFEKYQGVVITEKNKVTTDLKNKYNIKFLIYITRSKLFTFCLLFGYNCIKSLYYLLKYKPKYIVTTGAGTSIPICYFGKLLGKKIVYIESFARVSSKSLAGKLIYPISDLFIVQWKEMLKYYPKAKYFGMIY